MIRLKVTEDNINVKLKTESPLTFKVNEGIPIYPVAYTGDYEKTPTEEEQTLSTNGLMMTDDVTIHAIDSEYVGSDIPRRTELLRSGATITAPSGYYDDDISEMIPPAFMRVGDNYTYVTENNVRMFKSSPFAWAESEGYVDGYVILAQDSLMFNAIPKNTTITPSSSAQTIGGANYMMEGAITVEPIPNNYGLITWNGSTLTVS